MLSCSACRRRHHHRLLLSRRLSPRSVRHEDERERDMAHVHIHVHTHTHSRSRRQISRHTERPGTRADGGEQEEEEDEAPNSIKGLFHFLSRLVNLSLLMA